MPRDIRIYDAARRPGAGKGGPGGRVIAPRRTLRDRLRAKGGPTLWVAPDSGSLRGLVETIAESPPPYGRRALLCLERPSPAACAALATAFHPVLPGAAARAPLGEIEAILAEPRPQDFCIAADWEPGTRTLTLWRGDLTALVVPLSFFPRRPGAVPDARRLAVLDHGQTLRLGRYESSFDAILFLRDREYRRHAVRRRRETDRSLGGSLRRLRRQKGLRQGDFPGVPARTILRIENGQTPVPRASTLLRVAQTLGVEVGELGEF